MRVIIILIFLFLSKNIYSQEGKVELYFLVVDNYRELAKVLRISDDMGLVVMDIAPASNAYKAGIRKGSSIRKITVKSKNLILKDLTVELFNETIGKLKPGEKIMLEGSFMYMYADRKTGKDAHTLQKVEFELEEHFMNSTKCIVNTKSKFIHQLGMKHSPKEGEQFDTVTLAKQKYDKLCPVCFDRYKYGQNMPDEEMNLNEKAIKHSQLPILKEPETFNSNDKEMVERVKKIGADLVKNSARPYLNYSFLIADIEEPNAFALPGGVILITKGLYELTESDSELAFVIAHEIIHINCFHTIFNIRTEQNWQIFGAIMGVAAVAVSASSKNSSGGSNLAVGIISGLSIYQIIAQIEMKGYKKSKKLKPT